jgi:hypothetical protein
MTCHTILVSKFCQKMDIYLYLFLCTNYVDIDRVRQHMFGPEIMHICTVCIHYFIYNYFKYCPGFLFVSIHLKFMTTSIFRINRENDAFPIVKFAQYFSSAFETEILNTKRQIYKLTTP